MAAFCGRLAPLETFREVKMSDLLAIFENQAPKYDLLVSREDYQGNLLRELRSIVPFERKRVVEFGAGTGRVTRQIAPIVESIQACDSFEPMLKVAEQRLRELHLSNWQLFVADHRKVPLRSRTADIALAAWSICCLAAFEGPNWEPAVDAGVQEMERVLVPGGWIIIIETLGTGFTSPNAPEPLRAYYNRLESGKFMSKWIRTDYRFQNMDEAMDLTTFFFGKDPVPALARTKDGVLLPECTGIWWKQVAAA
jgi:ubiquinone/menaquinone biosynthesis C-methylase UbiE